MGRLDLKCMSEEVLKHLMKVTLELLECVDKEISTSLLQNEQFVLDFYDKLNEISVRR